MDSLLSSQMNYGCLSGFLGSGAILIMSSIRRIVIAASVANLKHFTFEIVGSSTPICLLSLTAPEVYFFKYTANRET